MRIEQTMVGAPIFTQDGSQIGKVKEVHGQFFKVDAPMQPDFWLSEEHLASGSGGEVRLAFSEDRLGDYKLGDPEDYEGEQGQESDREQVDVTGSGGGYRGGGTGDFGPGSNEGSGTGAGIEFDSDRERAQSAGSGGSTLGVGSTGVSGSLNQAFGQESDVSRQRESQPHVTGWADAAGEYQSHWQSRYGSSGGRWEDYEPGYRYGHEMAHDPRYQGREWADIEPDLRQNYGQWSQQYGYRYDDNEWDRIKEHAREALSRGRIGRAA